MPAQCLHQGNVTYAQPEKESMGVGLGQRFLRGGHCDRIAAVNVGDAGSDDHALRCGQEQSRLGERLASRSFAKPKRAVS